MIPLKKYKLGELIEQRREKNPGGGLPICGVTKEGFIPPKQQDADTSIYNVFYMNDFVFNPARMELNSIVFNDVYEKAICSSLYEIFFVKRTDIVLPAYLGLWVKRDTFTRYCEFLGSGSAREYCRVANISEMDIELPDLETQERLVKEFAIIKERIKIKKKINDNLEAQARVIFDSAVSKFSNTQAIGTFGKVLTGKTPPTSNLAYYGNDIPFIKTPDMHGNIFVTTSECYLSVDGANSQANKYIPPNTVIVACIGANAGEVAITSYEAQTNQQINSVVTSYPCFLYFSIRSHTEELRALGDGSSTMININKTSFENYEIPSSTPDELTSLEESLAKIFNLILANTKEIDTLSQMKELIVSTLSC